MIRFPGHHWNHCDEHHDDGGASCMICSGGIHICTVCGGCEGTLPEDCPGVRMTEEQAMAVYRDEIDYRVRHGGWTSWTRDRESRAKAALNGDEWRG